jgi:hypothetical protein
VKATPLRRAAFTHFKRGEWGIRTPEGLHPTRFPSVRHRPLGEFSLRSCPHNRRGAYPRASKSIPAKRQGLTMKTPRAPVRARLPLLRFRPGGVGLDGATRGAVVKRSRQRGCRARHNCFDSGPNRESTSARSAITKLLSAPRDSSVAAIATSAAARWAARIVLVTNRPSASGCSA